MISEALAMGGGGGGTGGGGGFMALLPIILMFAIIYFLLLRPQQKRQRQQQMMLDSLRKGDRVVTSGGIFGTVVGIKEKQGIVVLRVADNVKIELTKISVARIVQKRGEGELESTQTKK
ncbi:MAG: preprotein translocase subunit YajC [bacterium]